MPEQKTIHIGLIDKPLENPNVMSDAQFELLKKTITENGFLQPILVVPEGGRYRVVDGDHRYDAARALDLKEIPCVVADLPHNDARAVQIGMNKIRGELDLARVAQTFVEMSNDGWSTEELTVTGYAEDEIVDLLKAASDTPEEDIVQDGAASAPEPEEDTGKTWTLELVFETKPQLARAKRALRKAAGKGVELSVGLLKLIDTEEE